MRRWILPLVVALVEGRTAPAHAASLVLEKAAPCLDADGLTALVERELGIPLGAAVPLRFEVSVARLGRGYAARLHVNDERGGAPRQRAVEALDCAALRETVALAVTLALSSDSDGMRSEQDAPEAADASGGREPASGGAGAPASVVDQPELSDGAKAPETAAWAPSFSAGLLVDTGTLPGASLGVTVRAALDLGGVQVQALATRLFDQQFALQSRSSPDAGATLGFVGGSLLACAPLLLPSGRRFSSRACLGWELGQVSGAGTGIARPRRGRLLWSAPRLDLGGRLALAGSAWGLGVSLTAEAPLERDDFTLGTDVEVHRAPALVGRAALGIDLAFE